MCLTVVGWRFFLQCVEEVRYRGVTLMKGRCFRISIAETELKFFIPLIACAAALKKNSSELIDLNLIKSYCKPVLLHGTEVPRPNKSTCNALDRLLQLAVEFFKQMIK